MSLGEAFVFVECFAEDGSTKCTRHAPHSKLNQKDVRKDVRDTYICPTEPATSVHNVSISSFNVCSAKTLSSGSVSERKPRTPEAEVKPGMMR